MVPYEMDTPQKCPFLWWICTPSNACFLRPTSVFTQNGISVGSAVFAQLTVECPYTSQWATTFPQNCPFPLGDLHPHHGSLGPPNFCSADERDQQTHRYTHTRTHHTTRCVAIRDVVLKAAVLPRDSLEASICLSCLDSDSAVFCFGLALVSNQVPWPQLILIIFG